MSGTKIGKIKAKLGLKGDLQPGEMLSRFNEMKSRSMSKSFKKPVAKKVIKLPIKNKIAI